MIYSPVFSVYVASVGGTVVNGVYSENVVNYLQIDLLGLETLHVELDTLNTVFLIHSHGFRIY